MAIASCLHEPVAMKNIQRQPSLAPLAQTIFHEPWWLRITCDGDYGETVVSSGGLIVGRLPYRVTKVAGRFTLLDMPRLVHVLGPVVAPQFAGKNFPKTLKEFSIIGELIAQLPKASHITFRLHGGTTNTLAFKAAGFTSSCSFTVEVSPDIPERLWRQLRDKTRNVIRRAQECLAVSEIIDVDTFLNFYELNLQGKQRKNEYERPIAFRLLTECLKRNAGRILIASDANGAIQAAVFTVWDTSKEYYFMATRRMGSVNGATSLLIWEALQHASSLNLIFDMDGIHVVGSNVPNLLLLTGFGGTVVPRYQVQKSSSAMFLASTARTLWRNCPLPFAGRG